MFAWWYFKCTDMTVIFNLLLNKNTALGHNNAQKKNYISNVSSNQYTHNEM